MSSQDQATAETSPLLGASQPPGRSGGGQWSPETLLIPVVFAFKLGSAMPSTTLAELLRQTVCRLSHRLHGYPSIVPGTQSSSQSCDAPHVMQDFATVTTIIGLIGGITSLVGCGILSRVLQHHGRKHIFLFILSMEVIWSCLVLGSQFMPAGLADWAFFLGILFHAFSDNFPFIYIINVYIVDVCVPEHRTAVMSKLRGWNVLGVSIPLALGGSITTKTGDPLIVFYIATAIFIAASTYVVFVLPETFPEEKRSALSMRQDTTRASLSENFLSVLRPLKLLVPTREPGGTRNWRLTWCASHNFMFTTAHGYIWAAWFVVASSRYHITPADNGLFWSCVNFTSTITLTVIVPQLVRFLRPYYTRRSTRCPPVDEDQSNTETLRAETSDRLDVHLAFVSCIFVAFSALFAAMSGTKLALFFCAVMTGLGFTHGPTTHSLVSKSVGQLKQELALAAIHMVESIAHTLSQIVMGSIFTATVATTPLLLFYVHMIVILMSTGLLLLVRDEDGYHESNTS